MTKDVSIWAQANGGTHRHYSRLINRSPGESCGRRAGSPVWRCSSARGTLQVPFVCCGWHRGTHTCLLATSLGRRTWWSPMRRRRWWAMTWRRALRWRWSIWFPALASVDPRESGQRLGEPLKNTIEHIVLEMHAVTGALASAARSWWMTTSSWSRWWACGRGCQRAAMMLGCDWCWGTMRWTLRRTRWKASTRRNRRSGGSTSTPGPSMLASRDAALRRGPICWHILPLMRSPNVWPWGSCSSSGELPLDGR